MKDFAARGNLVSSADLARRAFWVAQAREHCDRAKNCFSISWTMARCPNFSLLTILWAACRRMQLPYFLVEWCRGFEMCLLQSLVAVTSSSTAGASPPLLVVKRARHWTPQSWGSTICWPRQAATTHAGALLLKPPGRWCPWSTCGCGRSLATRQQLILPNASRAQLHISGHSIQSLKLRHDVTARVARPCASHDMLDCVTS